MSKISEVFAQLKQKALKSAPSARNNRLKNSINIKSGKREAFIQSKRGNQAGMTVVKKNFAKKAGNKPRLASTKFN
jgi:hypothetical protein